MILLSAKMSIAGLLFRACDVKPPIAGVKPAFILADAQALAVGGFTIMVFCTKCKIEKPPSEFYKNNSRKNGYYVHCKTCAKKTSQKYCEKNKEKIAVKRRQNYIDNRERDIEYSKKYMLEHPEQTKKHHEKYAATHKEQIKQNKQRYYLLNKDKISKRTNEWHRNHPDSTKKSREKSALKNHEKKLAANKQYRLRHPEIGRIYLQRRLARKKNLPHQWLASDWVKALTWWHGTCAYCGNPPSLFDLHAVLQMEHYIPVKPSYDLGVPNPGTVPSNILPCCQNCNLQKGNKDPRVWLRERFGKHRARQIEGKIADYFEWVKSENDKSD